MNLSCDSCNFFKPHILFLCLSASWHKTSLAQSTKRIRTSWLQWISVCLIHTAKYYSGCCYLLKSTFTAITELKDFFKLMGLHIPSMMNDLQWARRSLQAQIHCFNGNFPGELIGCPLIHYIHSRDRPKLVIYSPTQSHQIVFGASLLSNSLNLHYYKLNILYQWQ